MAPLAPISTVTPTRRRPTSRLIRWLVETAEKRGQEPHVGPVATVDVFYNPDSDYFSKWRSRGILAFEMETSVLYYLAARARAAGADVAAATILTVSDVLSEEAPPRKRTCRLTS